MPSPTEGRTPASEIASCRDELTKLMRRVAAFEVGDDENFANNAYNDLASALTHLQALQERIDPEAVAQAQAALKQMSDNGITIDEDAVARLGDELRESCDHPVRFSIHGYETAEQREHEYDAVDYCVTCNSIRLWGVGWMEAPEPSEVMKIRLREAAENKCSCGELLGEQADDKCHACLNKADLAESVPKGFWLGELTGSGVGLCHVFSEYAGNEPHRLPHTAVCGASTGRGAEVVEIPKREMCHNCEDWLGEKSDD